MSEARQIKVLEDARTGVGSKERRSGGVSWDRNGSVQYDASRALRVLSWQGIKLDGNGAEAQPAATNLEMAQDRMRYSGSQESAEA